MVTLFFAKLALFQSKFIHKEESSIKCWFILIKILPLLTLTVLRFD